MRFPFYFPKLTFTVTNEAVDETGEPIEKIGETLSPNLRALRLGMRFSDVLLSMGVAASDVVTYALDITETYCKRAVHIDISSNQIIFSQDRGIDREPLTLMRSMTPRDTNYMVVQQLQELARHIKSGYLPLEQAEKHYEKIRDQHATRPSWSRTVANALVSTGVVMLFSYSWALIGITFVLACIVDRLVYYLSKNHVPRFFGQAAAATLITLVAAGAAWIGQESSSSIVSHTDPTLIVVGGIVMLVAGMTIFSAIQDAIDEFYLTATARIFKVGMMTTGIVVGILFGMYIAQRIGWPISVSDQSIPLGPVSFQLIGAIIISTGWAYYTQAHARAILASAVIGGSAWMIYLFAVDGWQLNDIVGNGIAALFVGFLATIISRAGRMPAVAIITAGVVPLVPGLMLYRGLMQIINNPPGTPHFEASIGTLFAAVGIGFAIAAGATLGAFLAKPLRDRLVFVRNLTNDQQHTRTRSLKLADAALTDSEQQVHASNEV